MKEVKITRCIINEHQELIVNTITKFGDYDPSDYHLLRRGKSDGTLYDFEIKGLTEGDMDKEIKQKRKDLAFEMGLYAERVQEHPEVVLKALYSKYGIKSRTELTNEQLDIEIERYRSEGLQAIT